MEFLRTLKSDQVEWKSDQVEWVSPWFHPPPVAYCCGHNPWVPLFGLWGVTSYSPVMVRRQFGGDQFIPATHGLNSVDIEYGKENSKKRALELRETLRQMTFVGKTSGVTPEYPDWHRKRVKDIKVPPTSDPNAVVGEEMEDIFMRLTIQFEREREGTEAQRLARKNQQLLLETKKKMQKEGLEKEKQS